MSETLAGAPPRVTVVESLDRDRAGPAVGRLERDVGAVDRRDRDRPEDGAAAATLERHPAEAEAEPAHRGHLVRPVAGLLRRAFGVGAVVAAGAFGEASVGDGESVVGVGTATAARRRRATGTASAANATATLQTATRTAPAIRPIRTRSDRRIVSLNRTSGSDGSIDILRELGQAGWEAGRMGAPPSKRGVRTFEGPEKVRNPPDRRAGCIVAVRSPTRQPRRRPMDQKTETTPPPGSCSPRGSCRRVIASISTVALVGPCPALGGGDGAGAATAPAATSAATAGTGSLTSSASCSTTRRSSRRPIRRWSRSPPIRGGRAASARGSSSPRTGSS